MSQDHNPLHDHFGPLAAFAGTWEGDQGVDMAPVHGQAKETPFRERLTLEPIGPVVNGQQTLYGLRYHTTAWPLGASDPFHEEVGYWLWDSHAKQVMRSFMVPRGVVVLAGGPAEAESTTLTMHAEAGAATYGILSNPYLDTAARTVRYDITITRHQDGTFSYIENTHLQIQEQTDVFHHTDRNTLTRRG